MRTTQIFGTSALVALLWSAPAIAERPAGAWRPAPAMDSPRWEAPAAVVNGKILVFGGNIYSNGGVYMNEYLSSVEEYDPISRTWSLKEDLPVAMRSMTATAVNGKVYVIGGHDASATTYSTVLEYDPELDTYTPRASMSTPRFAHAAAAAGSKIYIFGGVPAPGVDQLSSAEVYDPDTDTWSPIASMPTPRSGLAAAAVGGRIYLMGGATHLGGGAVVAVNEEYDVATDTWQTRVPLPTPRGDLRAAAYDGHIYVVGGIEVPNVYLGAVRYCPTTDSWTSAVDPILNRAGHALVLLRKRPWRDAVLYALGGHSEPIIDFWPTTTDTVERLVLRHCRKACDLRRHHGSRRHHATCSRDRCCD